MPFHKLQDLPSEWAHFCLNVYSFVQKELGINLEGRRLLVALSAGPDSTALLRALYFLAPRLDLKISAAHLNHCLRREADQEQEAASTLCSSLGIHIITGHSKVQVFARRKRTGLEDAARNLRYRFLRGAAARMGADFILTGHHLNDLAEDVFMRLQRGAGWPALSGMQAFVAEHNILRPFLLTPRKKILDFLQAIDQEFVFDKSNLDPGFLRNRIRMCVLQEMESINPNFLQVIANLWKLGREDQAYWEELLAGVELKMSASQTFMASDILASLPRAARLRWYKKMLDRLGSGQALLENIFKLDDLWISRKTGVVVQFPGNKVCRVTRQGIEFKVLHT